MTLLGLDFDNTLVNYDNLFVNLAREKNLIKCEDIKTKIDLRTEMRANGQEEEFTELQGEVYGSRILGAKPTEGLIKKLKEMKNEGIKMVIVSHKTKWPYKGKKYNLHKAAMSWLIKYNFFNKKELNWNTKDIYFETTKEDKINRIKNLNCTHYIDDLEEILRMLPREIERIHYNPSHINKENGFRVLKQWADLKL